jgi:hypothetical protein
MYDELGKKNIHIFTNVKPITRDNTTIQSALNPLGE